MKINLEEFKEKLVLYFRNAKSIVLIIASMAVGAWGYKALIEVQSQKSYQHITRTMEQTSVAVNESGELLIINKETGDYVVYDNDVYLAIFNMQFQKIQSDFASKDPVKK